MSTLQVAGRASFKERGHDLYETPPQAVNALLDAEVLPPIIWEPACGPGAIARTLRSAGYQVHATDLVDYDSLDQDRAHCDFLLEQRVPPGVQAIVTNPPFKLANKFVQHGLELCPYVVMLLRLTFLESVSRTSILESGDLARIHVFKNRLPMMHRAGWTGNKVTNPTAFAWFVWDRNHLGPATVNRIAWNHDVSSCADIRGDEMTNG
jgi:hypothetical protein